MISSSIFLAVLPLVVSAANDWSQPCLQGICSYDVAESTTSMPGSMTITGSTNAISDITTAAGWEILGCDPNAESSDIRLVCKSSDTAGAGCDHLYQNGAANTIVRLPQDCLKVPFARVARAWVPDDQSIPSSVAKRIIRRADDATPQVKALALDTNWSAAAGKQDGNVTLAVMASNVPGVQGNGTVTAAANRRRSRMFERRGFGDFVKNAIGAIKNADSFNKTISSNLPPIDINKSFPVFSSSLSCGGKSATIDINANAKAHAQVTLGVVAAGTLIPPKLSEIATYTGVTANLDGTLSINADLTGSFDSGQITLFQLGLPGLDIPKILTVGPEFKLNAQTTANLDVNLNMDIDLSYDVQNLKLLFPPVKGQASNGAANPQDTPLKLAVTPNLSSKGDVQVHLIPTVDLGVSALGNIVSATIFLNVDANAGLNLNLDAAANAKVATNGTKSAGASVNGCVDITGGVAANAGAQGSFFDLFNDQTVVPIFSQNFDIFQKCFGASAGTPAKRSLAVPPVKRALACPAAAQTAAPLVDETVKATSFKKKA
ncbi:hypothetical protein BD410DRAFT_750102 [Rickenella mellea]|uniref:DUF7223 domain-containing protein n=1 Tax=Rickenella mellea TaxID=50990 RepID=A0A4Y7Q0F1_9AGAM|nr:hypothetical protein BD410DRAFT_750102 [Rickenella mellea]